MGYLITKKPITSFSCFYDEFTVKVGAPLVSSFLSSMSFSRITQQTAAVNNETFYNFYLSPGAYTFNILGQKNATSGISTVYIDDILVGNFDWYSATTGQNVTRTFTHTITSDTQKTLSIVVASKNPTSTNFGLVLTRIFATLT